MWCTRWFLPLLLLPLPTASPYFLFLFFFSLTLHARPCFYCIILLTALFTSSCYWQPVPTRTLLRTSFPNVSLTAPLWYIPNASFPDEGTISPDQLRPMPNLTPLLDRCWCDLSSGHIFDPYNMTLWQLTSLSHMLAGMNSVLITQGVDEPSSTTNGSDPPKMARAWLLKTSEEDTSRLEENTPEVPSANSSFAGWFRPVVPLWWPRRVSIPFPFNFGRLNLPDPPSAALSVSGLKSNGTDEVKTHLLRRRYDLRPYGINLVVDFGWGRSNG